MTRAYTHGNRNGYGNGAAARGHSDAHRHCLRLGHPPQ